MISPPLPSSNTYRDSHTPPVTVPLNLPSTSDNYGYGVAGFLTATLSLKVSKPTRAGSLNYSPEYIISLLDAVSDVETLGANHWAVVDGNYASWANTNERPRRDQESLKNTFDEFENSKKKTGDPSCPSPVRRAKHVARAIQKKCAARILGTSDEEDDENGDINRLAQVRRWISDG